MLPHRDLDHARLAVGETVILLHPALPLAGASTWIERGRQQNDSLADGHARQPLLELAARAVQRGLAVRERGHDRDPRAGGPECLQAGALLVSTSATKEMACRAELTGLHRLFGPGCAALHSLEIAT